MGFFNFGTRRSNPASTTKASKAANAHPTSASQDRAKPPRPRQEPRHTVPIFSIQIRAECFLDQDRYVGNLWDVSPTGACVRSSDPIPPTGRVRVRLHDHAGDGMVERLATLMWSDSVMNAHYVGLRFDEPLGDDCGFLRTLLHLSANPPAHPLSRLGPIRLNPWPL